MGTSKSDFDKGGSGNGAGAYPASLKKPFLIFACAVILALILAVVLHLGDSSDSPKAAQNAAPSTEKATFVVAESKPAAQAEPQVQKTPESSESAEQKLKDEASRFAKIVALVEGGEIPSDFNAEATVYFTRDAFETRNLGAFEALKDELAGAKIIVISGSACDLGSRAYNENLIAKRVDFARNYLALKNLNAKILASNKPHIIAGKSEEERQKYRKVSIYLYK